MAMTVILLNNDFKPVPLSQATRAKVLNNPQRPGPYFVTITPEFKIPPGTIVIDGSKTGDEKETD